MNKDSIVSKAKEFEHNFSDKAKEIEENILGKAKEIGGTMTESLGKAIHSDRMATAGQQAQESGLEQGATATATYAAAHDTKDASKREELKK